MHSLAHARRVRERGFGSGLFDARHRISGCCVRFWAHVLTMAYPVGHVSGGHFNPAVTVGLWAAGRFRASDMLPYIAAQVVGPSSPRLHDERRGGRLCRHTDRARIDLDSFGFDPGDEHLGEPSAKHRASAVCGRRVYWPALAVLARPAFGRSTSRVCDPLALCRRQNHRVGPGSGGTTARGLSL